MKQKEDTLRKKLYEVIEKDKQHNVLSRIYDCYILVLVVLSAIPLMHKIWTAEIVLLDEIITILFIIDYLLRWATADFIPILQKYPRWRAFLLYPFTPMAIIDLLAVAPMFLSLPWTPMMPLTQYIQILRIMRVFRCIRFFKTMRYAKSFLYIFRAVKRESKLLMMVMALALLYLFASAAFMFSVEPDTFDNFFQAIYWAMAMLTTVGYGDIYPVTEAGQFVSILSSFFGTAVVAMPASIITAGFIEEINRARAREERKLEKDVAELLEEVRRLREDAPQRRLEEQIALLTAQVEQLKGIRVDPQEDLKNIPTRGTIELTEESLQISREGGER
ncbi:MAG: ion transporter [Eubacteriales bacterium]|nr:ion transporter [Eubacteriales bacterium]